MQGRSRLRSSFLLSTLPGLLKQLPSRSKASGANRYCGTIGRVARWVCPNCEREFASANQAHVCVPGITVDDLLARHPRWVSEIYRAVMEHLISLGPVHEDAVNVGIFLKSDRKIARVPAPRTIRAAKPLSPVRADGCSDSPGRCRPLPIESST